MKHLILCIALLTVGVAIAQTPPSFELPTTNPRAVVKQHIASTVVEIDYHRPSMRGRIIFGDLVPYGQVWRTGSDAATRITFSTPVMLNGVSIDSGTYELFTIPDTQEWTIILQHSRAQWGSYKYDAQYDVARIHAKPSFPAEAVENFTISIDDIRNNIATIHICWDRVKVPIDVQIDLRATVIPGLEAALRAEGRRPYFHAAMFYFENDLDIDRAAELMQKALDTNPGHIGMLYRLALILERKGDREGAVAAAEKSLEGAAQIQGELGAEYTKLNTTLLQRLKQK